MYKGIGASKGIAMAPALVIDRRSPDIQKYDIDNYDAEIARFDEAIYKSKLQIMEIKKMALEKLSDRDAMIFDAHMLLLEDPELINSVHVGILSERKNAEYILGVTCDRFVQVFDSMDNELMRQRAADIKDVCGRIIDNLLEREIPALNLLTHEVIIVAHDLTPSDTAQLDKGKAAGFVTDIGGRTSHTAILARSMGIPAILGLVDFSAIVKSGDFIIMDGTSGEVIINPDNKTVKEYSDRAARQNEKEKLLLQLKKKRTTTADGKVVELAANIGSPKDLESVLNNGAEGIGLYRTEILYMGRKTLPTEEEQFEAYKIVLEAMGDRPVIIRTLDIGGDKEVPGMNLPKELNPFLGYRAIRICLDRTDIFKTQLRALLRASMYGNLKIMYPMISSLNELRSANMILKEASLELDAKGIEYNRDIKVGIMIEIPSAALISDILAKEVDFLSIGTNDLLQYSVAVDRGNEKIAHLYTIYHPGFLRLIKMIIENGHKEGICVGMCGEAAGEAQFIPLLIGLGLDEFSMSATSILQSRQIISKISKEHSDAICAKALEFTTAAEVEEYLASMAL